ncbi:DUF6858 family protein [Tepidiphilus sp. HLB4]|jgi:hypothetical protein
MKQMLLQEKYPVFVLELDKKETNYRNVDEIVAYLKEKIAENPKVQFLGVFDHLAHTRRIGGEIMPGMQAAVDVLFCFGLALPNPLVLAVRPRSIGVADLGDKFVLSFMEAPMPPANEAMEAWVRGLRTAA